MAEVEVTDVPATPPAFLDKLGIALAFAEFRPKLISRLQGYAKGSRRNDVEDAAQRACIDAWSKPPNTFKDADGLYWWCDKAARGFLVRKVYQTATGQGHAMEVLSLDDAWQTGNKSSVPLVAPVPDEDGKEQVAYHTEGVVGYETQVEKAARLKVEKKVEKARRKAEARRLGLKRAVVKRRDLTAVCGVCKRPLRKRVPHDHKPLAKRAVFTIPFDISTVKRMPWRDTTPLVAPSKRGSGWAARRSK